MKKDRQTGVLKVVQVLLSPRIGGAEALVSSLDRHWRGSSVESTTVYVDPAAGRTSNRFKRIGHLRSEFQRVRPDVVLAHSAIPNVYARIAAPLGVPVVTVLHSASDDFSGSKMRLVERLLLRRTAQVVAVSATQGRQYESHFGVGEKLTVIPNGIRDDIRLRTEFQAKPKRFLTLARVAPQKNPRVWIEAVQQIEDLSLDFDFTWAGPISDDPGTVDEVQGFTGRSSIGRFLGPTVDPASAYETADALFHPSDREAHSIGILEAAAAGLPIVCSRSVMDTVPRLIRASTFEDGDAASAVKAILDLEAHWEERASEALAVAPLVQEQYSIAHCARKYALLCEDLLNRRPLRS